MKIDLKTLKITLIIIIFCSGVFGVLSPRLFKPFGSRLSYASLLSSGVLMAAALVHLLGDAADGLESSSPLPLTSDGDPFPWAYFFCGSSFYFLYFFERFVLHALAHKDNHNHNDNDNEPASVDLHESILGANKYGSNSDLNISPDPNIDENEDECDNGPPLPINSSSIKPVLSNLPSPNPIKMENGNNINNIYNDDDEIDEHGAEIFELMVEKNYLTGIVLLIGLGLHSFLAGVALGSSNGENQAVALGIAIISHKYLAAFALGVPLYKANIKLLINIFIAILFGILTPCGIGVGWILSKTFDGWVGHMFVSIAAGTFIYVSICEVLIPEFSKEKKKDKITYRMEESRRELSKSNTSLQIQSVKLKLLKKKLKNDEKRKAKKQEILKSFAVIIGFIVMSLLAFWV